MQYVSSILLLASKRALYLIEHSTKKGRKLMLGQAKHKLISLWYFLSIFPLFYFIFLTIFGFKQSFAKAHERNAACNRSREWQSLYGLNFAVASIEFSSFIRRCTHTLAQAWGMGAWQVKSPRPSGWITKFTFIPAQSVNYDNDKDVKTNARMGTKCDGFMLSACVIEGGGRGRGGQLDRAQVSHWNAQFLSLIQWILTQQFVVKVKRSDWGDYWPKC